jgi:BirA family transcriptional regulator, biotin operon repressor / biotin---[acetyl-CoA-carboxylase] ligase
VALNTSAEKLILRPLAFKLLAELSAEHFTSGVALAKKFNVSRSAISDALKDATDAGIEIFSLTRRGYRLATPIDLLDIDSIRLAMGDKSRRLDVDVLPTTGSTNTELLARAAAGAGSGTCVATEIQTAGRGRRGRAWQSQFASSLTFSLLWRFEKGAAALGGLSLVVGLALVRALRQVGVRDAMLKWPNDVIVSGEKLAGILIETQGDMLGPTAAIIGVGVNVRLPPVLKQSIDQPATDVASHLNVHLNVQIARNELLAAMLRELVLVLDEFSEHGFKYFKSDWLPLHALQEQIVTVRQTNAVDREAIVKGIADDGALIVEFSDQPARTQTLTSAEISIRMTENKKQSSTRVVPQEAA